MRQVYKNVIWYINFEEFCHVQMVFGTGSQVNASLYKIEINGECYDRIKLKRPPMTNVQ